ncbi:hypothetical protein T01_11341 [Trichinella spiralis]|uniref:Uncharacterized protein n=1 Tax=Trichinella spiralis TaxID=6334 RepID=A0A0V1AK00_TRISP|nr:hypothetical protein T01_11341 [Trichinella spiralis]
MSIQLAHLTRKSSKHGSEDYGYDREGADDGRELSLRISTKIYPRSLFSLTPNVIGTQNFQIAQQSLF